MKTILVFLLSLFILYGILLAQQQVIVATLEGGQPVFSVQQSTLMQAFEDEFDGTSIISVHINQNNGIWKLYGEGTLNDTSIWISRNLSLNSNNFTISLDTIATMCKMYNCLCYEPCETCVDGTCTKANKGITNGAGYLGNFGWILP